MAKAAKGVSEQEIGEVWRFEGLGGWGGGEVEGLRGGEVEILDKEK